MPGCNVLGLGLGYSILARGCTVPVPGWSVLAPGCTVQVLAPGLQTVTDGLLSVGGSMCRCRCRCRCTQPPPPLTASRLPCPCVAQDMQRPLYMQPKDALAYGIIDGVVSSCFGWVSGLADCGVQALTCPGAPFAGMHAAPKRGGACCRVSLLSRTAATPFSHILPCPNVQVTPEKKIIDDVKSADQWDKEAGLVAR